MTKNIMIVGVGGQGSLLASKLLGEVAEQSGLDVKVSEVHGMSQRGGSVVTYVRYGEHVASPVIKDGEADFILSLELLEAARWLPMLKKGGVVVTAKTTLSPATVLRGDASYPEDIEKTIADLGVSLVSVDAEGFANVAGMPRAANVALMGAFARRSEFALPVWQNALKTCVKERFLAQNEQAFMLGYNEGD